MSVTDDDETERGTTDGATRRPADEPDATSDAAAATDGWDPLYFAFVMATGIVSIAALHLAPEPIAWILFGCNVLAYAYVAARTIAFLVVRPSDVVDDLADPDRAVGSFAAVAATCVLGAQFHVFDLSTAVAAGLLVVGAMLWLGLTYAVFAGLTVRDADVPIGQTLDGSWFLIVVGTQSVAVLAGSIAPAYSGILPELALLGLGLYSVGAAFYLVLLTLVFYRLTFYSFDPADASPPYWINMGAVAITTLAGAELLALGTEWAFLAEIRPFLIGFTFFFWATGTWWIPLLLVLGVWRHAFGGIDLPHTVAGYDLRYWGMVFPLGMYTVSTLRYSEETALDVRIVSESFVFVALLAWLAVTVGLSRRVLSRRSADRS